MYKPLPDSVEIRNSPIHGVGLFAKTLIKKGKHLGISHVYACLLYTSDAADE